MRKIFNIILLFVTIMAAGSCRRASDNGKIDGFWRIDEINYKASGETVCPSGLFIAVNLELLQLDDPAVKHTGIISYHKGDSRLGVEFPYNPSKEELYRFGFPENPCVLDITVLTDRRLVLSSSVGVISCTRY